MAITEQRHRFVLVELKTDNDSLNSRQNAYLRKAQVIGMRKLADGILMIRQASQAKRKYQMLTDLLAEAGLVEKYENEYWNSADPQTQIEVLYILLATADQNNTSILFAEVVEIVSKHTDEFSQRFAHSLTLWAKSPDAT